VRFQTIAIDCLKVVTIKYIKEIEKEITSVLL